jgi:branched-subunit amino acid aminotransferase/4-amino-4-deoxychorismate lyase
MVRERKLHESLKENNTNEILLCDDTHRTIYEGTSSNFFAVVSSSSSLSSTDNTTNLSIVIAPHEHVLRGTIMRMVEEICQELSIPIQYRFATIDEARTGQWHGAFLTSNEAIPSLVY